MVSFGAGKLANEQQEQPNLTGIKTIAYVGTAIAFVGAHMRTHIENALSNPTALILI